METVDVAILAREMTQAGDTTALARRFLRAVCASPGLDSGFCYWQEAVGEQLLLVAGHGVPADSLPAIPMEELDNPLVYGLMGDNPCHVERLGALVGVGASFEKIQERFAQDASLLAVPLHDDQRKATGVLAVVGQHAALRGWARQALWRELLQLFETLIARLHEAQGASQSARQARAANQQRAVEQGRAARLLAAEFIGVGPSARRLRREMLRLADSTLSLLVTGETGSGKDHAAWLIHQASSRAGKFVPVNCAAIPKDLIEAELFGAERGAFTGATHARAGLVAEAHGGTLFLDEIGDMPLTLQGTLLRLLNEKKFRPVGSTREQPSDFRLICATHRSLPELVKAGDFREDLFFRIRQQVLHVPPLRERPEDIPALVGHILLQHNRLCRTGSVAGVLDSAMAHLQQQSFPGNVRELRSLVLAAAERTAPGAPIHLKLLIDLERSLSASLATRGVQTMLHELWQTDDLPNAVITFERLLVGDRLRRAAGSRSQAAQSLGIPKRTLARKCLEWNLNGEDPLS